MEDVTAGPGLRQLHVCNLYSPLTCFPEGSPGEQRAGRTPGTASFPPTRFFWKSLWSRCHLGDCPFFVRGLAYPTYNWRHKTEISHYESQTNAHKLASTTKKKGVRRATPQRLKAVTSPCLCPQLPTNTLGSGMCSGVGFCAEQVSGRDEDGWDPG